MKVIFQDPLLMAGAAVLAVTFGILLWALSSLHHQKEQAYELPPEGEDGKETAAGESAGLAEARLQEIINQLALISQRLADLEKASKSSPLHDQTIPSLPVPPEIEKTLRKIEARLESIAAEKPQDPNDGAGRLEAKLEGIHRLLILLTDSGASEQK
ncbi:MAG: hypothetical protein ACYC5N_03895 [Endomicrobiales bacterium]